MQCYLIDKALSGHFLVGSQDIEIVQALPAIFFPLVRFDFARFDLASFAIPPSAGDEVQGQ